MVPASSAFERPIDRSLALLAAGDAASALQHALRVLEHDPPAALAAFVVGRSLRLLDLLEPASQALRVGATLAVDASNLPLAVACGAELRTLGSDPGPVFDEIARAFSRSSVRASARHAAPPELPGPDPELEPPADSRDAEPLAQRASTLLAKIEAEFKKPGERPTIAAQPLFSSLDPDGLRELVAIFEVLILPAGARVVGEATSGTEAFIVARGEVEVERRARASGGVPVKLARLSAGALIGEMALLSRAPRTATVITLGPSVLLVANKTALDQAVERAPQIGEQFAVYCKRRMIENLVRTSAVFRAANPQERPALVERFALCTFEPGEALATQGERGSGLHLVASGAVSIQHRDGGESVLLASLGPGDVVGEVALIFRRPAIADAIATHPTITLFLPESQILDLVRELPKVFANLYTLAVRRDQETASIALEEATETDDFVLV